MERRKGLERCGELDDGSGSGSSPEVERRTESASFLGDHCPGGRAIKTGRLTGDVRVY